MQWFNNLQITPVLEESEVQKLRVCHKHFRESDYNNTVIRRMLLCTAVPSIYVPQENVEHIVISTDFSQCTSEMKEIENREEKENNKELQSNETLESCNKVENDNKCKSDGINIAEGKSLNESNHVSRCNIDRYE